MSVPVDPRAVRQRFSKAAAGYAVAADIQAGIARDLAARMPCAAGERILDVGAGHGDLAFILAQRGVDMVALDGAWGMVSCGRQRCPGLEWVQADAGALPFGQGSFTGVVSSSAYQWVDGLPVAFREVRRVLKPGGFFQAALFGRFTLQEFFDSLARAAESTDRELPVLRRLPSSEDVLAALKAAGFKDPVLERERRMTTFEDVHAILHWLKDIGANMAAKDFFWGKALLAAVEREYRMRFSDGQHLRAGFEVLWVKAEK